MPLLIRAFMAVLLTVALTVTTHAEDIVATGLARPELQEFDQLMIDFLKQHELPGAAFAIGHKGQLVYARGFGFADVEAKQAVQPESLFRIASISKPVTAAAILKLVQQRKLKLDDKAFEIVKHKPHLADGVKQDVRLADITIQQLLQHTAGWDRDKSFDPMFQSVRFAKALNVPAPAKPEHVIQFMLGQPLDFSPGERYAYSNFGYCVLGRVIEVVTKQPYEEYVQTEILKPIGITSMRIGRTRLSGRFQNEVRYFSKKPEKGRSVFEDELGTEVAQPYGAWNLEAMDAHGGWIASAPDLVRFAMAFAMTAEPRLLDDETMKLMFERPNGLPGHKENGEPRDVYYGLGWLVRRLPATDIVNYWHNGSLPGTSTVLAHLQRHDVTYAVLFNSRDTEPQPSSKFEPLMHEVRVRIETWPGPLPK